MSTQPVTAPTGARLGRLLLDALAAPFWALGWALGTLLWPLWLAGAWVVTAVALGFADARPKTRR